MEQRFEGAPEGVDLGRLLDEYGDGLLRMCTLYLRDAALAEDAVQDTMLKALAAWPGFRGECSEKTFLTGIAANVCRDYLRSPWRKRRAAWSEAAEEGREDPEPADDTLVNAVLDLPKKYRETVVLYYYQELSVKEIAELLLVGVSTVTARLSRARGMLRDSLRGWYYDEE